MFVKLCAIHVKHTFFDVCWIVLHTWSTLCLLSVKFVLYMWSTLCLMSVKLCYPCEVHSVWCLIVYTCEAHWCLSNCAIHVKHTMFNVWQTVLYTWSTLCLMSVKLCYTCEAHCVWCLSNCAIHLKHTEFDVCQTVLHMWGTLWCLSDCHTIMWSTLCLMFVKLCCICEAHCFWCLSNCVIHVKYTMFDVCQTMLYMWSTLSLLSVKLCCTCEAHSDVCQTVIQSCEAPCVWCLSNCAIHVKHTMFSACQTVLHMWRISFVFDVCQIVLYMWSTVFAFYVSHIVLSVLWSTLCLMSVKLCYIGEAHCVWCLSNCTLQVKHIVFDVCQIVLCDLHTTSRAWKQGNIEFNQTAGHSANF